MSNKKYALSLILGVIIWVIISLFFYVNHSPLILSQHIVEDLTLSLILGVITWVIISLFFYVKHSPLILFQHKVKDLTLSLILGVIFWVIISLFFYVKDSPLILSQPKVEELTLAVNGKGKVEVPADQFSISIGVHTVLPKAEDALNVNSEKMKQIEQVIAKLGITKKEYKTAGFSLSIVYTPKPRNAGSDWQKKIIGYQVTNTFNVKSKKMDIIGKLISETTTAGANNIGSINFSLSTPLIYRDKAINFAVKHARDDANSLAAASEQKIVNVKSISLNNAYMPTLRMANTFIAKSVGGMLVNVPVQAGNITVTVNVSIIYGIVNL